MPTFLEVFEGEADKLRIAIVVTSTRAVRTDVTVAVWELTHEKLLLIAKDLAAQDNKVTKDLAKRAAKPVPPLASPRDMAIRCDEQGIENRFFRMNQMVADWIDETEPVDKVDYAIL